MSRLLVFTSLVATLTLGAHAEWKVGVAIGLSGELAAVLPVAIDSYVLAALLAGRDVKVALLILAASIGGGHAYIGASEGDPVKALIGAVVGLVLVAVLWRVEELAKAPAAAIVPDAEVGQHRPGTAATVTTTVLPAVTPVAEVPEPVIQPRALARPRVAAAGSTPARTTAKTEPELSEADLELGRVIAAELAEAGQSVTVRALTAGFRERDRSLSSDRAAALARALRA